MITFPFIIIPLETSYSFTLEFDEEDFNVEELDVEDLGVDELDVEDLDEEELDEEERVYVLYGSYVHNAVQDALNNTTLTLRNKDGKIIFSCTKESACFISVKRCAEKGYDKIIQEIKKLNYSFDPTLVHKGNKKKNNASVEQDSVSMVPEQTMEDE